MNDFTASAHRHTQSIVDAYIRDGGRPRSLAERRLEREICYADRLKAIVDHHDEESQSEESAG